MKSASIVILSSLFSSLAFAAPVTWQTLSLSAKSNTTSTTEVYASQERLVQTSADTLADVFTQGKSSLQMSVPTPDGNDVTFTLTETQVMASGLAAKYSQIKTYSGTDSDGNRARFTWTGSELTGMFQQNGQWANLSPYGDSEDGTYASYYRAYTTDLAAKSFNEQVFSIEDESASQLSEKASAKATATGDTLTTYRLAVTASGEYSAYFGGTTSGALAAIVDMVNRINEVLLVDLAIQFELVDNNDELIYLDADTDPFENDGSTDDLAANQSIVDSVIGSANYDIGHLVDTAGGGLAYVGVVCNSTYKAQGYTGSPSPTGDSFYIDLVAHELGHQLDATHSFNGQTTNCDSSQRSGSSAWEPGSGSTIMGYAGLCGSQNLQTYSDPYYHTGSIEQMRDYLDSRPSCGTSVSQSNTAPVISVTASSYTIPADTPFVLTGSATDSEDDTLTYNWEEIDAGGTNGVTTSQSAMNTDNGYNPLYRSYEPSEDGYTRYFPGLSYVLNGTTTKGEIYPSTDRDLTFRLTARDSNGGVDASEVSISVVDTGAAFAISSPVASSSWTGGESVTVNWATADTDISPISCSSVSLYLDTGNSKTFTTTLLASTDNDGTETFTAPNLTTSSARLMLRCDDNIFYAVSGSFSISQSSTNVAPVITAQANTLSTDEDTSLTISLDDLTVSDSDGAYPEGYSLTLVAGSNYTISDTTITPDSDFNGNLSVGAYVNDGIDDSNIYYLDITVNAVNDAPVASNSSYTVAQDSTENSLAVLDNDSDVDSSDLTIISVSYSGAGTVSIASDSQSVLYTPASGTSGSDSFTYVVSDGEATDTATVSITITASSTDDSSDDSDDDSSTDNSGSDDTDTEDSGTSTDTSGSGSSGGSLGWITLLTGLLAIRRRLGHSGAQQTNPF